MNMLFANYKELATSPEREKVLQWAQKSIRRVSPEQCMPSVISLHNGILHIRDDEFALSGRRIFVIGAGKASAAMAVALENIIGEEKITAGIVLTNVASPNPKKIMLRAAGHPVPSEEGMAGVNEVLEMKKKFHIGADDIVIGLISGGGSSMMSYPVSGITMGDKQKMYELFIKHGMSGRESTILKTKISQVKGGGLARHFAPAQIISLVISDDNGVSGHHMTASGPFAEHVSSFSDAWDVVKKYNMEEDLPARIKSYLLSGEKEENAALHGVHQIIVATNEDALDEIRRVAESEGFAVEAKGGICGEAKEVAYKICSDIHNRTVTRPTLFLYGGETTVTLDYPHKKGGRNQEFVAACLQYLAMRPFKGRWCIASIGTDGIDFVPESAGAIIDTDSLRVAEEKGLSISFSSFLEKHKTGRLLGSINSNVQVGRHTGTNVGDIMLFLFCDRE